MNYRSLGKTQIKVSEIGLGTEYLFKQPRDTVVSVIHEAIKNKINYFDLVYNFNEYLDNLGAAFKGLRKKVILTAHIGAGEKNGQYKKTRVKKECEKYFFEVLERLDTDYVDIINIQFVTAKEIDQILKSQGLMNLALRLKKEGKARFIGLSTHDSEAGLKAIRSGMIDTLMYPINLASHTLPGKSDIYAECAKHNVGLIGMKPFAGGKLMQQNRTVYIAKYQTGGKGFKKKISNSLTPVQCLHYVLSQVGVKTVVPGVKNLKELQESLDYLNASTEEKDYSSIIEDFKEYIHGECVYCNHCLPCPVEIDVGNANRLIDATFDEVIDFDSETNSYSNIIDIISKCTKCGICMERCPFGVDVISKFQSIEILSK